MSTRIPTTRAAAAVLVALALTVSACDSNEPEGGAGDEELITQVRITMTNAANASDAVTITALDPDGPAGSAPLTFSPARVTLRSGATYNAMVQLDDTINNASITAEVGEEAEEHLFQYTLAPFSAGTVTITDRESDYVPAGQDENGAGDLPVGLRFRVAVAPSASGNGTLNATLFHFDDGAVKNSATATSDERDIDLNFPLSFSATVARQ